MPGGLHHLVPGLGGPLGPRARDHPASPSGLRVGPGDDGGHLVPLQLYWQHHVRLVARGAPPAILLDKCRDKNWRKSRVEFAAVMRYDLHALALDTA